MRTVTPSFFQITNTGQIAPTYEVPDLKALLILLLSSLCIRVGTLVIMPEFTPTPDMLKLHGDKGIAPWEIYAWCVRDAISKQSGIKTLDEKLALADKLEFIKLMNGEVDSAVVNGHRFSYQGDKPI